MPLTDIKNKIELELQILCTSLRHSWAIGDSKGVSIATKELRELFPDLVPHKFSASSVNYYEILGLGAKSTTSEVTVGYFKKVRQILRDTATLEQQKNYVQVLNAGLILRKHRLRISHDILFACNWLNLHKTTSRNNQIGLEDEINVSVMETFEPARVPTGNVPRLVQLLLDANAIGEAEAQALSAQMKLAPEVPVERLTLNAGYVTMLELNSLKLAETLLDQGKISLSQFQVAFYDERNSGVRMAESLQVRGWLAVQVEVLGESSIG